MRAGFQERLCCPDCRSELVLEQAWASDADAVVEGSLRCGCERRFPIIGGIPRLVPMVSRWRVERRYPAFFRSHPELGGASRPGPGPLQPPLLPPHPSVEYWRALDQFLAAELRGSLILDAECGDGANALAYADAGARVVAMGATSAVDRARDRTRGREVDVLEGDVHRPPLREDEFDRVLCMSFLACDRDPQAALRALVSLLRPGGVFEGHARISVEELDRTGRALGSGVRLASRVAARISPRAGRATADFGYRALGKLFGGRRPRFSRDDLVRALADAGLEVLEVRDLGGWVATGRRPIPRVEVEPDLTPRQPLSVVR